MVALFDSGEHDEQLFYTMDYCDEGSAHDLVESSRGKLLPDRAVPIITDVLSGLAFAHEAPIENVELRDGSRGVGRGIVHRDLKPDNILLVRNGLAKLADLGLAKAFQFADLSGITRPGSKAARCFFDLASRSMTISTPSPR